MKYEDLLEGIAVIIDDEIENPESSISRIKKNILDKNIPVATYSEIPSGEAVSSFSDASFIILDWDFTSGSRDDADLNGERISVSDALIEDTYNWLLDFIDELVTKTFAPVFIFTGQSVDSVNTKLSENFLDSNGKSDRIFVKSKDDVNTGDKLFETIDQWIENMPSVYVLKSWERTLRKAKNEMFNEMYNYSPDWVYIVWKMLKNDSMENQLEFGEYITRSLHNRTMQNYQFSEDYLNKKDVDFESNTEELQNIVKSERYIAYNNCNYPSQAYTGDLFKDGKKYYLNIRAQCATARPKNGGIYNPTLYCIVGKKEADSKIGVKDIYVRADGVLTIDDKNQVDLNDIKSICADDKKREELNKKLSAYSKRMLYKNGALLPGRDDKVILSCVDDKKILVFDISEIEFKKFGKIRDKRIGRVLPPYITQIQQKCAQYMIREGTMPLPEELFASMQAD